MKRILALLTVLLFAPLASLHAGDRPNVLFIAVDDLNHWVGHLGRNKQTKTPNIDRLAAMGVTFANAQCAAPVCNPSRAALLSGKRPGTTGIYNNNTPFVRVLKPEDSLVMQFKNAGYDTLGIGKLWHGGLGWKEQWTTIQEETVKKGKVSDRSIGGIALGPIVEGGDEAVSDTSIADYGIASLQRKHDKPFFLAVGFHKPHMPWHVPRKWFDLFPLESIKLPPYLENDLDDLPPAAVRMAHPETDHVPMQKSGRWKEAIQAYLATIAYCDMNLGRLLDAFEKSAYRDNTIICLWGDHGWHLGEKHHWRKFALWEEATKAPFMWVVPGVTKPNTLCERTVDFMSIFPTLTDLCGIPTPAHNEGVSIRRLLADPKASWDLPARTTYKFNNHTVRSEGWRYIRYANGDEELYDEAKDPNEWTNLAAQPGFAARKAELAAFLPKTNAPDPSERAPKEERQANKRKKDD